MVDYKTIVSTSADKTTLLHWLKSLVAEFGQAKIADIAFANDGNSTLTFTFTLEDGCTKTATCTAITLTSDEKKLITEMQKTVTASDDGVTFNKALTIAGNVSYQGNGIHQGTESFLGETSFSKAPTCKVTATEANQLITKSYVDNANEKCYQALKTVTKDFTRTDPVYVRIGEDGEPEIHYTFANESDANSWFADMNLGDATIYVHNGGSLTSATGIIDGATLKGIVFDDLSKITPVNSNLSNSTIKVWKCLGKVKDFGWSAFGNSINLETLYIGDTSTITYLGGAFFDCQKLNPASFSNWNTSNVTEFGRAFDNARAILANLPLIDTSKGTTFDEFLWDRFNNVLKFVPAYNLSNGTNLDYLLGSSHQGAFKLEYFHAYGMKASFDLSFTALKHDAILEVFNNLGTVDASAGITLTLGSEKLALMSDEEKAIATGKGWVLA